MYFFVAHLRKVPCFWLRLIKPSVDHNNYVGDWCSSVLGWRKQIVQSDKS